jgi:hypothetical protein
MAQANATFRVILPSLAARISDSATPKIILATSQAVKYLFSQSKFISGFLDANHEIAN